MPLSQTDKIEKFKAGVDYLKHLTTLSTGSIVLIAAFLEKVFSKPLWKITMIVSLIGFMISVLFSTITYTIGIAYMFPSENEDIPSWVNLLGNSSVVLAWIGFLIGILSLAVFAVRNFI